MTASRRMVLWGVGVGAGHVVLGLVGRLVLEVPGSGLFFGLCAALSLGLALLVAPMLEPRRPPDEPGEPRAEDPEPPPWWPEFEREFRAHVARRRTPA